MSRTFEEPHDLTPDKDPDETREWLESLDAVIDMVVRLVLSHVMQPSADPAATADDIAWVAERVLA